jgi:hypothetical protein
MIDRKISAAVIVCACAAIWTPAAYAAPCGITSVAVADDSPIKVDADTIDSEVAKRHGDIKIPGQEVVLRARTTGGPTGTVSFRWVVGGDLIDDYHETPAERIPSGRPETDATANPFAIDEHADFSGGGAAFSGRSILFYWRMRNIALPANVDVTVDALEQHGTEAPHVCATDRKTYTVDRDKDDPDSQPEDFYVEINHSGQVLREHAKWHSDHMCCRGYDGRLFPVFHSRFLANFDAFRATFGYPDKGQYTPPDDLPARDADGFTLAHTPASKGPRVTKPRSSYPDVSGYIRPTYSTVAGGTQKRPRVDPSDCLMKIKFLFSKPRQRLADFPTLAELGCVLESPWHNRIHGMIGGDLNLPGLAPTDPIFWRWHGYLNSVFDEYASATSAISMVAPVSPAATVAQSRRRTTCNGLTATIRGTSRPERLRGTRRADVIWGGGGRDTIVGAGGNDVICGGPGNDRLSGGAGFDELNGGGGADQVLGGRDGDSIEGGAGRDRLAGRGGPDLLFGGAGRDRLDGGPGNEWIIDGGGGRDRLAGGRGVDVLRGGPGNDRLAGGAGPDALDGGAGNDALNGGSGEDTVMYVDADEGVRVDLGEGTATGDGRDRLRSFDRVEGSSHADTIVGGSGGETIIGGEGNDDITGGGGEDALNGGTGTDDVGGGTGDDYCAGEEDASRCED